MFRNDPRGADNLCGGVWNSQKWVESLAQDQHRARVYFGLILAAVISGLSAAVIAFAAQGPALRWLVVGVAFVAGALFLVALVWITRVPAPEVGAETPQQASGMGVVTIAVLVGVTGVLLGDTRPVVQAGAGAAGDGYLVALALLARRRVVQQAR